MAPGVPSAVAASLTPQRARRRDRRRRVSAPTYAYRCLNKFIANSGVCSRREADTLIQAGVVTVNGEVVTELGTKVNIHEDDVRFNGERLKGEEKVYIIMNKPKGFVTTASDPHADKTVVDLVSKCPARVYPVGRLDKNTTGVLLLTNDGEIAERLTHPSYDKKKIYQVALGLLSGPDRPPAIFCATDDQAFGVLRAARELRIDVPGGLAVAGFDDVKEAGLTDPPLTTVYSDRPAMARAAVDLVLDDALRVSGSRRERLKQFPSALVVRRSCGCGESSASV